MYILPKDYMLSNNEFLNLAINTLENPPFSVEFISSQFEIETTNYVKTLNEMLNEERQIGKEEGMKEAMGKNRFEIGMTKTTIKNASTLFKNKCDKKILDMILGKKCFHSNDVFDYLMDEDDDTVVDFVLFLNKSKLLIVDK